MEIADVNAFVVVVVVDDAAFLVVVVVDEEAFAIAAVVVDTVFVADADVVVTAFAVVVEVTAAPAFTLLFAAIDTMPAYVAAVFLSEQFPLHGIAADRHRAVLNAAAVIFLSIDLSLLFKNYTGNIIFVFLYRQYYNPYYHVCQSKYCANSVILPYSAK